MGLRAEPGSLQRTAAGAALRHTAPTLAVGCRSGLGPSVQAILSIGCMLSVIACESGSAGDAQLMIEPDSPATRGSVLAESISIETSKGQLAPILAADCRLPCSETVTFEAAEEGQGEILIYVFRGNTESTDAALSLGTFEIAGLPPTSGDAVEVQVSFRADRAGVSLAIETGSDGGATLRRVGD